MEKTVINIFNEFGLMFTRTENNRMSSYQIHSHKASTYNSQDKTAIRPNTTKKDVKINFFKVFFLMCFAFSILIFESRRCSFKRRISNPASQSASNFLSTFLCNILSVISLYVIKMRFNNFAHKNFFRLFIALLCFCLTVE